jgi:hypothetical protein
MYSMDAHSVFSPVLQMKKNVVVFKYYKLCIFKRFYDEELNMVISWQVPAGSGC